MPSGKSIVASNTNWGADVNCGMPIVKSPIVAARISLFYELMLMWYFATKYDLLGSKVTFLVNWQVFGSKLYKMAEYTNTL